MILQNNPNVMNDPFLNEHPDVDKLFEKLRSEPDSLVFAPLADSCRRAGRLDEALEICIKGLGQHPEYSSGHIVLGKCYYDKGEKEKAAESFQKVLSIDENNLVALKFLGMILVEQGQESVAMEHFNHILALDPENNEIRNKLESLQEGVEREEISYQDEEVGIIHLKDVEDEEFEGKTIVLGDVGETSDEFATLTLADIYVSQGYKEKARKIYTEILEINPDNMVAKGKLEELDAESMAVEIPDDAKEEPVDGFEMEALVDDEKVLQTGVGSVESESSWAKSTKESSVFKDKDGVREHETTPSDKNKKHADFDENKNKPNGKSIDKDVDLEQFKNWIQRMKK